VKSTIANCASTKDHQRQQLQLDASRVTTSRYAFSTTVQDTHRHLHTALSPAPRHPFHTCQLHFLTRFDHYFNAVSFCTLSFVHTLPCCYVHIYEREDENASKQQGYGRAEHVQSLQKGRALRQLGRDMMVYALWRSRVAIAVSRRCSNSNTLLNQK
jgi:hypothetical protein